MAQYTKLKHSILRRNIYSDNLDIIRQFHSYVEEDDTTIINEWDIIFAVKCGAIKVLKWLLETLKMQPHSHTINEAFMFGQFEIFFYLIDLGYKKDISIPLIIRNGKYYEDDVYDSFQQAPLEKWKEYFTLLEGNVSNSMKLISSLCKDLSYILTLPDVHYFVVKTYYGMSANDFNYIIQNNIPEAGYMNIENTAYLFNSKIDIYLPYISRFSKFFTSALDKDIIEEIINNKNYDTINKLIKHIIKYGIILEEDCPFNNLKEFDRIIEILDIPFDIWLKWVNLDIYEDRIWKIKILLKYGKTKGYYDNLTLENIKYFFLMCFNNSHKNHFNIIIETFPQSVYINWLEVIKLYGFNRSVKIKNVLYREKPYILEYINFQYSDPIKKELWYWCGNIQNEDYETSPPSDNFIVNNKYKDFKSIEDVKNNLNSLNANLIERYTFKIDNEIFFKDLEENVSYAIESSTGRIYVYNEDDIFNTVFVARNLGEFLFVLLKN